MSAKILKIPCNMFDNTGQYFDNITQELGDIWQDFNNFNYSKHNFILLH